MNIFVKRTRWSAVCLGLALSWWAFTAQAVELRIVTESFPPYQMADDKGHVYGLAADKVHALLKRVHQPYSMKMLPWKQAFDLAKSQRDTCVFSTTRTLDRELVFHWVGPIGYSDWTMYALSARGYKFKLLSDLKALKIGSYQGDIRDAFLRQNGFKPDAAANDQLNLDRLLQKKIDVWVSDRFTASGMIARRHLQQDVVPVFSFNRVDLYLACHPETQKGTVETLNKALLLMNADGSSERLEKPYENWVSQP